MREAEFDQYAEDYRSLHADSIRLSGESPDYFASYKVDDVAERLADLGVLPERILDFGGGIGNSITFLRSAFPDAELVLLDPSEKSLAVAEKRHSGQARITAFDGVTIPFADAYFDLVFVACVFHHIPERDQVPTLGEINRVLRSGGSVFVFEHNPFNPLTVKAVADCVFDKGAVLISASEMRSRMAAAGFGQSRICYRIFLPHFLRSLRPLEKLLCWLPLGGQYFVHASKPNS
ncbi:class I SAM-dependent methyltransferase [Mesorhizobium sp. KR9-304]|uniref:class I SAM-dependent methyltransferase n=1 Tax=Mesorhizobium sp. KR9-304 TaxID=3156614 RepID=UPI0032B59D33